jgi:hypothetical protein
MSSPDLGQFLLSAHRRMAEAERVAPTVDTSLDAAAEQLARLTAILPRYLELTRTSSAGRPWSGPAADMDSALSAATRSLARWTPSGSRSSERSPDYAGMIGAAADSLDAGHELLRTHLDNGPDGFPAGRSWWGPVIRSPQVTAAIFDELTAFAAVTAAHASYLAKRSKADTATGLQDAHRALAQAAEAGRSARWHTASRADKALLLSIPIAALPLRPGLRDAESEAGLCAGIITSAERLRHAAWRSATDVIPDGGGDAWQYTATTARIACHLAEAILRSTPDEHHGPLTVAAATAGRASQAWRDAATAWTRFRTDTLPVTTSVMTDTSDLITRLGRLAYTAPDWTPASGTRLSARRPDQARTVLAVLHHVADTLTRMAAGDLIAIATTVNDGRLYALSRDQQTRSRYAKVGGQHAEILHQTYLTAFDTTSRLADHLDQIALSRATPSILLTKMRAAAPIQRDVIWHHHADEPEPAAPVEPGPFQLQMQQLGIYNPDLLDQACQLDQAADAALRRATLEHTPPPHTLRKQRPSREARD